MRNASRAALAVRVTLVVALTLAATPACDDGSMTGPIPPGEWGGEGVALIVTSTGGDFEFDCAVGSVDEPLILDDRSSFAVVGILIPGGGPEREGEDPRRRPATYEGSVRGDRMELTVRLLDTGDISDPYTLRRGETPFLRRCL
jgi:hypothetical protein